MQKLMIFLLALTVIILFGCAQRSPIVGAEPVPQTSAPEAAPSEPDAVIVQNPGPGPYVGTAIGYEEYAGTVTVTLEVKNKKLTSVTITGPSETPGIGSRAIDEMGPVMLKANSIVVDTISGATHTSESVLLAAKRALGQAGLTDADLVR